MKPGPFSANLEPNQCLATEVAGIFNRGGNLDTIAREILRVIRELLGCDAVGLRMRKGDDCPYYVQYGFSDEFVREENCLCARREDGDDRP